MKIAYPIPRKDLVALLGKEITDKTIIVHSCDFLQMKEGVLVRHPGMGDLQNVIVESPWAKTKHVVEDTSHYFSILPEVFDKVMSKIKETYNENQKANAPAAEAKADLTKRLIAEAAAKTEVAKKS